MARFTIVTNDNIPATRRRTIGRDRPRRRTTRPWISWSDAREWFSISIFSFPASTQRSTLARDEPLAGAVHRCQKKSVYAREVGAARFLLACDGLRVALRRSGRDPAEGARIGGCRRHARQVSRQLKNLRQSMRHDLRLVRYGIVSGAGKAIAAVTQAVAVSSSFGASLRFQRLLGSSLAGDRGADSIAATILRA